MSLPKPQFLEPLKRGGKFAIRAATSGGFELCRVGDCLPIGRCEHPLPLVQACRAAEAQSIEHNYDLHHLEQ